MTNTLSMNAKVSRVGAIRLPQNRKLVIGLIHVDDRKPVTGTALSQPNRMIATVTDVAEIGSTRKLHLAVWLPDRNARRFTSRDVDVAAGDETVAAIRTGQSTRQQDGSFDGGTCSRAQLNAARDDGRRPRK